MPIVDLDVMDASMNFALHAFLIVRDLNAVPEPVHNTVELVGIVTRRCNDGDLRRLRIFGHGSPGSQGLGNSVNMGNVLAIPLPGGISWEWMLLRNIAHCFGPDGYLQLHGCQVGAGQQGKRYVSELARILNVPVSASVWNQRVGVGSSDQFEAEYIEAIPQPGGGVSVQLRQCVSYQQILAAARSAHGRRRR
jgi:hypothetical protein